MRIFYLITELDVGGAEKALFEQVTRLDRAGFDPAVGALCGHGPVGDWLTRAGVEVAHFDMRSSLDWGVVRRVAAELRRRRPDILHTFLFHANFVGRIAARMAGVPRVVSAVRVEERRRLHLLGDWLTQGLMDVETCVSASAVAYTHRHARIPLRKLVAIPNGVDVARYEAAVPCPAEWAIPDEARVIAAVGRLDEQKDPMTLARALAAVRRRFPDVLLVWAGDGPLRDQVAREADALGLGSSLRLLGWAPDVRPLLARAEVFALASRWEGMPNSVLEAMASGAPVVATRVGGCAEMVADGETGFLVTPGDADELADRLARLLADPALARRMGTAGRDRARTRFSLEAMVAANVALYRGLMARK